MPTQLKIGIVAFVALLVLLGIFLLIGHKFGDDGTDSNNSNVNSNNSQKG